MENYSTRYARRNVMGNPVVNVRGTNNKYLQDHSQQLKLLICDIDN